MTDYDDIMDQNFFGEFPDLKINLNEGFPYLPLTPDDEHVFTSDPDSANNPENNSAEDIDTNTGSHEYSESGNSETETPFQLDTNNINLLNNTTTDTVVLNKALFDTKDLIELDETFDPNEIFNQNMFLNTNLFDDNFYREIQKMREEIDPDIRDDDDEERQRYVNEYDVHGKCLNNIYDKNGQDNKKRSRSGCQSCKKLRIKCDETKPTCEYCASTGKKCQYSANISSYVVRKPNHRIINKLIKQLDKKSNNVDLYSQQSINSSTKQLKISGFELKLVKLFKTFVVPFTNFIKGPLYELTTYQIPDLFMTSQIVRNAVFSFSCLNSWPTCHLNKLKPNVFADGSKLRYPKRMSDISLKTIYDPNLKFLEKSKDDDNFDVQDGSLFDLTSKYFSNLVDQVNDIMLNKVNRSSGVAQLSQHHAKELLISVFLIMVYLSLHSHNLTPIINFDVTDEEKYEDSTCLIDLSTDLLTIGRCVGRISELATLSVRHTNIGHLFAINLSQKVTHFPLSAQLRADFERYRSRVSATEFTDLEEAIQLATICIDKSHMFDAPMPIFKFMICCKEPFRRMVRKKDIYGLRIIFLYCMILQFLRFCLFTDKNIWLDFIKWYKEYNFQTFGGWKYEFDYKMYYILERNINLNFSSTKEFLEIDFDHVYNELISMDQKVRDDF